MDHCNQLCLLCPKSRDVLITQTVAAPNLSFVRFVTPGCEATNPSTTLLCCKSSRGRFIPRKLIDLPAKLHDLKLLPERKLSRCSPISWPGNFSSGTLTESLGLEGFDRMTQGEAPRGSQAGSAFGVGKMGGNMRRKLIESEVFYDLFSTSWAFLI